MTPYEFAKQIRDRKNKEAACHAILDEVDDAFESEGFAGINESQLTALCVEVFFGEVCNGGLCQFISNQSRIAKYGPDALSHVGLAPYAAILRQALERCKNVPEENDEGELEDVFWTPEWEDDDGPFSDLDKQFFDIYRANEKEFREKLFAFIVDHEPDFVRSQ